MLENVLDKNAIFCLWPDFRMLMRSGFRLRRRGRRAPGPAPGVFLLTSALGFAILGGCSSLRPKPRAEYVYVTAKETFLRDRLAAVTNRTGTVENGERLEVVEHARRYFRVKTPKGEQGWIDEKAVATQEVFDAFQALGKAYKSNPAVVSAVVRDDVNLHLKPGRQTEVFYRLPEGDKVQLLERATLPKPAPGWVASVSPWHRGRRSAQAELREPALRPRRRLPWRTGGWRAMRRGGRAGCCRGMWMWTRRIR
jgi:hypothetical protein